MTAAPLFRADADDYTAILDPGALTVALFREGIGMGIPARWEEGAIVGVPDGIISDDVLEVLDWDLGNQLDWVYAVAVSPIDLVGWCSDVRVTDLSGGTTWRGTVHPDDAEPPAGVPLPVWGPLRAHVAGLPDRDASFLVAVR